MAAFPFTLKARRCQLKGQATVTGRFHKARSESGHSLAVVDADAETYYVLRLRLSPVVVQEEDHVLPQGNGELVVSRVAVHGEKRGHARV